MASKTSMALIFGGASPEHEISLRSAKNIYAAIPREKYEVHLLGISQDGNWYHLEDDFFEKNGLIQDLGKALAIVPGQTDRPFVFLEGEGGMPKVDVAFPITHGPMGEDGSLQGILNHLRIPFVGPDVLGSSVAMDKDVAKRLLREADLKVAEGMCFHYYEKDAIDYLAVINQLGSPVFVKPANMGSSVGVKKAENKAEFDLAVKDAFKYDHKIIVEEAIIGRELECAVLGNAVLATSSIGEINMVEDTFYDFESKYESDTAADLNIPAKNLDDQELAKLILVAKNAYRALCCEGLSRVDMFLTEEGAVYVNEINTLPGFTSISMYPALWAQAGTPYGELIDELLQLAMERGARNAGLKRLRL
ncbi:MAG: D-alanine--D-alanine ligase [Bacteroidia bacterium]|nr:D-alanine--D-alanine ligase [Bacteroidia bacterium]